MGVSRRLICEKFGLARTTLGRFVCQQKAKKFRKLKLSWVENPVFELEDAVEAFGGGEGIVIEREVGRSGILVLPEMIGRYFEVRTSDEAVFTGQFLRFHFFKRRAKLLIDELDRVDPMWSDVKNIEEAILHFEAARGWIGKLSLPLIHDVVLRQISSDGSSGNQMTQFYQLGVISFEVLAEAIEGFDVSKDVAFVSLLGVRLNQRFAMRRDITNKRAAKRFDDERGYLYLRKAARTSGFDCLD